MECCVTLFIQDSLGNNTTKQKPPHLPPLLLLLPHHHPERLGDGHSPPGVIRTSIPPIALASGSPPCVAQVSSLVSALAHGAAASQLELDLELAPR